MTWLPYEPFVHWRVNGDRLLDPSSWEFVNSAAPLSSAANWHAVEESAQKFRHAMDWNPDGVRFDVISSWWKQLLPHGGVVHGLRGRDCFDELDLCFGTSGDTASEGKCLCRTLTNISNGIASELIV